MGAFGGAGELHVRGAFFCDVIGLARVRGELPGWSTQGCGDLMVATRGICVCLIPG